MEGRINLSSLFSSRVFRTPDYQRGYAWEEKQLSEFLEDLEEIFIDEFGKYQEHYMGTIYLKEIEPNQNEDWCSSEKFYDIVDGQQRLTTISILLYELLRTEDSYSDMDKEGLLKRFIYILNKTKKSKVYRFCYTDKNQNYKFLLHKIFDDTDVVLHSEHQNYYTKNLEYAKSFFREKINSLSHDKKEELYKKLTTSLTFDIQPIKDDLDVQAVFETLNNRGKSLSTLEKLKNRLIHLTVKLQDPLEDIKKLSENINDAWKKIYISLAKNPEQILNEDTFLSAHLSLYEKPKELIFSEEATEKKVFEMFCNKAKNDAPDFHKKINDYIIDLSELAPIWYEIHNSKSEWINKILKMNSTKEIKIFLAAILKKNSEKQEDIFKKIEEIFFRNRFPGLWYWHENNVANWARDIYKGHKKCDKLLDEINDLINKPIKDSDMKWRLKYNFTLTRGNIGFHKWDNLKYFLFEYENHLKIKAKESTDRVTLFDYNDTTIEHIIPQKFESYWSEEVNDMTNSLKDKSKIQQAQKVLINTLGNLTILKGGKNSELKNKPWKTKRERFRTGSYNESDISKNEKWDKFTIKTRGIDMLKFLESKISGLKLTDEERKRILFSEDDDIIEAIG
jgi:uncharacterized protein with ParB-like and HNH nuclease domain